MGFEQLRETCFFKTGRKGVVLEFIDQLYPNTFNDNSYINSLVFTKYSNIRATLIDARKSDKGKAIYYNLSPEEILLLTYLLSDGNEQHFKRRAGAYNKLNATEQLFVRQVIGTFDRIDFQRFDRLLGDVYKQNLVSNMITFQKNINTGGNNLLIRKFSISYEEAMKTNSKWKIIIEEGTGLKDIYKSQGLNIVKSGTYKTKNKSFLMLQKDEIVIPINESAKRVILAERSFYPIMKESQIEFSRKKFENKDFTGEHIDEWNPKGKKRKINNDFKKDEKDNTTKINNITKNQGNIKDNDKKLVCQKCGTIVDQNIYNYSTKFFKKPLCLNCQKEERSKKGA